MEKKNILIYGAGNNLTFSFYDLNRCYQIAAVMDGNEEKIGQRAFGLTISGICDALKKEYDYIVVTPANAAGINEKLIDFGADKKKIVSLQEALNLIPEDDWEKCPETDVEENGHIAVVMCGGMGDLLIGKVWLESVIRKYDISREEIEIYFAENLKSDGEYIFKDSVSRENIHTIHTEAADFFSGRYYKAVLRFCIVPEVWRKEIGLAGKSTGDFYTYIDRLWQYGKKHYNRGFISADGFCKTIRERLVDEPGVMYHTAFDVFGDLMSYANIRELNIDKVRCEEYLEKTGLAGDTYITLNTGLNAEYRSKKNTRAWAFEKWVELSEALKRKYPNIKIVQVGLRMREEDDIPADLHMNGRTSLEQIVYLLKKSLLHIDYDGGLVHVRHMTGQKSIVLMGSSASENHAYPENVYIQTKECKPCEWTRPDWLSVCGRGCDTPICMDSITVEMVMEKIKNELEEV